METKIITVSNQPDSSADYTTVSEALCHAKELNTSVLLKIYPGIYKEKITIDTPYISIKGMGNSPAETVLTYDDYANDIMEDGSKRGTFRTYSMLIDAHDITLENLTIENSAGLGKYKGQAIALYADGDRIVLNNCRLIGNQDTLFTGPLPPKELQPGGFIGPKQFSERINGRHYYKNCFIQGNIDYVFGSATAFFDECVFHSVLASETPEEREIHGYVTAASTPEGQEYGYVMNKCRFTSNCPKGSMYLGRPWRDYAQTILIDCEMDECIHPLGWNDWKKENARANAFYGELNSTGTGASVNRDSFVKILDDSYRANFRKEKVLGGEDNWNPEF